MTTHKLFYVRSATANIRELEFEIIVSKKRTWAKFLSTPMRGRRVLVGGKAFYTVVAAVRYKYALLHKVRQNTVLSNMRATWKIYDDACRQLRAIDFVQKVFH